MPGLTLHADAFVLLKRPPSDSFQNFTTFSPVHGALIVLQRLPKKAGSGSLAPLDLFDEASLILESGNQGRTWFVKEARLLNRSSGIGQSYDALVHASAFAGTVARNSVPEESRESVGALLRQVFAAFANGSRPDIAHFKALYCFARDEGHPLRQHWFPTLPSRDRAIVAALLNQPLAGQTAPATAVARLHGRLVEYLKGHTELLFD